MWIVDATDPDGAGAERVTAEARRSRSPRRRWSPPGPTPAGRAGGNLNFSPHNQQIVGDKIYLSNYHGGVIVLDAAEAFDGVARARTRSARARSAFKVPDVVEQRPIFEASSAPVLAVLHRRSRSGGRTCGTWCVYKGRILTQDMTGGFYSLARPTAGAAAGFAGGGRLPTRAAVSQHQHRHRRAPAPLPARCSTPRGRLRPRNVGAARLGRTRAAQRRGFVRTARQAHARGPLLPHRRKPTSAWDTRRGRRPGPVPSPRPRLAGQDDHRPERQHALRDPRRQAGQILRAR